MSRNVFLTLPIVTAVLAATCATTSSGHESSASQTALSLAICDDAVGECAESGPSAVNSLDEHCPQDSTPDNPDGTSLAHLPLAKLARSPGSVAWQCVRSFSRLLPNATRNTGPHVHAACSRASDGADAAFPVTATGRCILLNRFLL